MLIALLERALGREHTTRHTTRRATWTRRQRLALHAARITRRWLR